MSYTPPIKDMLFLLEHVFGFSHNELDIGTVEAIFDEAGKLASGVLAPLNAVGDRQGATLADGMVSTAAGFKGAYAEYRDGGWNSVPFSPDYGGQGLPWAVAFAIQEMWQGANMSFGLCPLLNQGAVEAISSHGSQAQKDKYLPKLISGEWTGTMNLTEPQAGSDLGLLKCKAEPSGDGTYKISGQKIFITYGEHDLAPNIIHLVLARLPDAPPDVQGISLFIVPKMLDDGGRNTVRCIGLEHKLGIHASPTCTMEFDHATGYLLGEPHKGLKYMFTMMNNARLCVGLQGVAVAEAALQKAEAFAAERVQGKDFGSNERVSIDRHPDVQRMILNMRALVQAGRALTTQAAMALDNNARDVVDFMTPIVKAWCTDMAVDVASTGIQIHGGMGYIEETGAAQFLRDARILPIYEGTNGIQATDMIFRKILRDEAMSAKEYLQTLQSGVHVSHADDFRDLFQSAFGTIDTLVRAGQKGDLKRLAFAAQPLLKGLGILAGGALLSRSLQPLMALEDAKFTTGKADVIDFYIKHILPQAGACLQSAGRH